MRTRVCASFMLRPSLLLFGFAPWFARMLREKLTAFLELESVIRATAERPEDCGARENKARQTVAMIGKSLLDYVIRQFQLIFGTAE